MLYRADVCNCTMPYVPRTVPAYAVRDPAYTPEVFALTLVQSDVDLIDFILHALKSRYSGCLVGPILMDLLNNTNKRLINLQTTHFWTPCK